MAVRFPRIESERKIECRSRPRMTGKCGNTPTYTVIGSGAVLKTVAHLWSVGSSPTVGASVETLHLSCAWAGRWLFREKSWFGPPNTQHWCNGSTLVFQTDGRGSSPLCCSKILGIGVTVAHESLTLAAFGQHEHSQPPVIRQAPALCTSFTHSGHRSR